MGNKFAQYEKKTEERKEWNWLEMINRKITIQKGVLFRFLDFNSWIVSRLEDFVTTIRVGDLYILTIITFGVVACKLDLYLKLDYSWKVDC